MNKHSLLTKREANLRNLLLTRVGERVMQPDFGTTLHNVLFEPMDDEQFEEKLTGSITDGSS